MKRLSIGWRLTLWYLAIFAGAQIVFATGMWLSLRHHLYAIVDDNLRDEVADLETLLQEQPPDASPAELQEVLRRNYADTGEYLEVYDEQGTQLFQSAALRKQEINWGVRPSPGGVQFQDQALSPRHLRFVTCWVSHGNQRLLVHFGLSNRQVREALRAFQTYLWMGLPLLVLMAAGGGYWLSRRALAPVDQLTRTARTITGSSLGNRLKQLHTGDELERLSDTLNEMLDRLEAAFRRVTEFTADASHELRTPISLIRTEAELALRRSRDPEEYRAALEHILSETDRTAQLLEQLLELARADSGRAVLAMGPLDLRGVIQQAGQAWGDVIHARGMSFHAETAAEAVMVRGDDSSLRRLLDILLDNALKYSNQPGHIRLTLVHTADRATIAVEDSGVGIPIEEQEKIFERFYRVDKARGRWPSGSGLGLSIARWIVQEHGGTIRVHSIVGEGSVFEVVLPSIGRDEGITQHVTSATPQPT
jgi:heavy metal sensor kinase